MLRYLMLILLLFIPTNLSAEESGELCLPSDRMLNVFLEQGYKIGGYGDIEESKSKLIILYNTEKRYIASINLTTDDDGNYTSCLGFVAKNFNTK